LKLSFRYQLEENQDSIKEKNKNKKNYFVANSKNKTLSLTPPPPKKKKKKNHYLLLKKSTFLLQNSKTVNSREVLMLETIDS
jgi:hypothetical protein